MAGVYVPDVLGLAAAPPERAGVLLPPERAGVLLPPERAGVFVPPERVGGASFLIRRGPSLSGLVRFGATLSDAAGFAALALPPLLAFAVLLLLPLLVLFAFDLEVGLAELVDLPELEPWLWIVFPDDPGLLLELEPTWKLQPVRPKPRAAARVIARAMGRSDISIGKWSLVPSSGLDATRAEGIHSWAGWSCQRGFFNLSRRGRTA